MEVAEVYVESTVAHAARTAVSCIKIVISAVEALLVSDLQSLLTEAFA